MSTNYRYKVILLDADEHDVLGVVEFNDTDILELLDSCGDTYKKCIKRDKISKLDWIKLVLDTCEYDYNIITNYLQYYV